MENKDTPNNTENNPNLEKLKPDPNAPMLKKMGIDKGEKLEPYPFSNEGSSVIEEKRNPSEAIESQGDPNQRSGFRAINDPNNIEVQEVGINGATRGGVELPNSVNFDKNDQISFEQLNEMMEGNTGESDPFSQGGVFRIPSLDNLDVNTEVDQLGEIEKKILDLKSELLLRRNLFFKFKSENSSDSTDYEKEYEETKSEIINTIREKVLLKHNIQEGQEISDEIKKEIEIEIIDEVYEGFNGDEELYYQYLDRPKDEGELGEKDISHNDNLPRSEFLANKEGFNKLDPNQSKEIDDLLRQDNKPPTVEIKTGDKGEENSDALEEYPFSEDVKPESKEAGVDGQVPDDTEKSEPVHGETKGSGDYSDKENESAEDIETVLTKVRSAVAKIENFNKNESELTDTERAVLKQYKDLKDQLSEKIRNDVREKYKNESSDNGEELKQKISREINEKLVEFYENEYRNYKDARYEAKDKGVWDKVKQAGAKVLETRVGDALRWYGKQNKWLRLGVTTVLFTTAGYAIGAAAIGGSLTSASAYGVGRLGRGTASIIAGGFARERAEKKWSEEDLNKKVEERKKQIIEREMTDDERYKEVENLKKWEQKERKRLKVMKGIVTVGAGLGAGLIAGLSEATIKSTGTVTGQSESFGAPKNIKTNGIENVVKPKTNLDQITKPKTQSFDEGKIFKSRFKPDVINKSGELKTLEKISDLKKFEKLEKISDPSNSRVDVTRGAEVPSSKAREIIQPSQTSATKIEKVDFAHTVAKGESTWKMLEDVSENKGYFKDLTEAQKTYITSYLTEKAMKTPGKFGLEDSGMVKVGKQVNFKELFEREDEIQKVINKAKEVAKVGSDQEKNILKNNKLIEDWVKDPENKGKLLTNERVEEILNPKPKQFVLPKEGRIMDTPIIDDSELEQNLSDNPYKNGIPQKVSPIMESVIENDQKLPQTSIQSPVTRSLESDTKVVAGMAEIRTAIKNTIDNIYGKKGFFGSKSGFDSEDWVFMSTRNADKTIKGYINYMRGIEVDPTDPESMQINKMFENAPKKHSSFMGRIQDLQNFLKDDAKMSENEIIPKPSENIASYYARIFVKARENGYTK